MTKGRKNCQILRDGIAEQRDGGEFPEIFKDGKMEYKPDLKRQNCN